MGKEVTPAFSILFVCHYLLSLFFPLRNKGRDHKPSHVSVMVQVCLLHQSYHPAQRNIKTQKNLLTLPTAL